MKKIFLLALLVLGALVVAVIYYFRSTIPIISAIIPSPGTKWKYEKIIATPITVTSNASDSATLGDLKVHSVSLTVPKGTFDTDTAVVLKTPDTVPNYVQSEMIPLGSPVEVTAGGSHTRLNAPAHMSLAFSPSSLPEGTQKKDIRVLYHDGSDWEFVRPTNVDMERGVVEFDTFHFSFFGANKVSDETKITEAWLKSAAFDKMMREGINQKSDFIANQVVDMLLKKMNISDESVKGKILADILKDDGYKDVIKAYASGDIADGGQKVAALCGSKIVELVDESTLSKALGAVSGSAEDIAAAAKALGSLSAGQYKDAAKIIGEQIADKFLITTAGKIAVEVINVQIDSWKNAEVEAAFQAYKNGANGAFWGYNVDAKDFDAVWTQMKGASRQLEIEAIAKENEIRKEAGMPLLTDTEADAVRLRVKDSYRSQFETRMERDAELAKTEENLRIMMAAFKKAGFFSGALAPVGLDKGLDYENTLNVLSHFMTKMMKDTKRMELSGKEGLIMDKAISISDIVQGARIYFSGPDGKKKYEDYLKDRFGITLYPALSDIAGAWENGTMTITDVIVAEELKKAIAEGKMKDSEECDFSINFEELKGKSAPFNFTLSPSGETSGTMTVSSSEQSPQTIPFTYTDGVLKATMSDKGAVGTISVTMSTDPNAYIAAGTMNINFKEGLIKIIGSISSSKAKTK